MAPNGIFRADMLSKKLLTHSLPQFFPVGKFSAKIRNVRLEIHFGEFGGKIEILSTHSVGKLQLPASQLCRPMMLVPGSRFSWTLYVTVLVSPLDQLKNYISYEIKIK